MLCYVTPLDKKGLNILFEGLITHKGGSLLYLIGRRLELILTDMSCCNKKNIKKHPTVSVLVQYNLIKSRIILFLIGSAYILRSFEWGRRYGVVGRFEGLRSHSHGKEDEEES